MTAKDYPFLRLLIPFCAGIVTAVYWDAGQPLARHLLLLSAILLVFTAFYRFPYRYRWLFGSFIAIWMSLAGYALTGTYTETAQPGYIGPSADGVQAFSGWVYEAPGKGARIKVRLLLESCRTPDTAMAASGHIMLMLEPTLRAETLRYGDRLTVSAPIMPTEAPKNPHAFDYRQYLHFQNIHHQAFVRDSQWRLESSGHGYRLWRWAYTCRDRLLDCLRRYFPDNDEYAVASALLVGYKDDLSDDLQTAYAETGSMHALAVSGTHVSMLYAGLMLLWSRLPQRRKGGQWYRTLSILLFIWAFTFVTGATASVLRASVMFSVYLFGKTIYREASAWNVLAASAFLLLWVNPFFLFDAGFQLSYCAVAGMVFFYPRLYRISPLMHPWMDMAWQTLLVGFAAQLGTLPLTLYYFHQFPVYFWLSGWVVIFVGAVFLWGGFLLVLLDFVAPGAAFFLGKALYWMLWGMNRIILWIQTLPGSVVNGIWLNPADAWLVAALVFSFGGYLATRHKRWIWVLSVFMLALGINQARLRLHQSQRQAMVWYAVSRETLIDFFDGRRVWSIADTLTKKQERFAALNHRWAWGMCQQTILPAQSDTSFFGEGFLYQPPLIQFRNKRIVWLRRDDQLPFKTTQIPCDLLVISGGIHRPLDACLKHFPCREILLDGAHSRKQLQRWKKACREAGVACHVLREQGAFSLDFSN